MNNILTILITNVKCGDTTLIKEKYTQQHNELKIGLGKKKYDEATLIKLPLP